MARFKVGFKKKINVGAVASKIVVTVLGLYVGGTLLDSVGDTMNGTTSPFYSGLSLIGWTVSSNQITSTSGATTGILSIVGIVGIASVIMEFVNVKMI